MNSEILLLIELLVLGVHTQIISKLKCEHYKKLFRNVKVDEIFGDKSYSKITCPKYGSGGTIIGGERAHPNEYPAMASLLYENDDGKMMAKCGAVLISENFLLTAAHCVVGKIPKKVILGEVNLEPGKSSKSRYESTIAQIIVHPQYKKPASNDDIALLRLPNKLRFQSSIRTAIRPACLVTEGIPEAERLNATGWGYTYGEDTTELQVVSLPVVNNEECSEYFRENIDLHLKFREGHKKASWKIPSTQICAGEMGKDTCQGDSGGPLFYSPDKKLPCIRYVAGITSFGQQHCGIGTPGVFTKVSSYINWIENNVWIQKRGSGRNGNLLL